MSTLLNRRKALLGGAALATLFAAPRAAWSQAAPAAGPFTLPPLPYAPDANEPHIDAQTMEIHHDRHHAAYVNNLNAAVKDHAAGRGDAAGADPRQAGRRCRKRSAPPSATTAAAMPTIRCSGR